MRLVTFKRNFEDEPEYNPSQIIRMYVKRALEEVGIISSDGKKILPLADTGYSFPDMNTMIAEATPEIMQDLSGIARRFNESEEEAGLVVGKDCRLLSPIPCPLQDVICLGLNYTEHA